MVVSPLLEAQPNVGDYTFVERVRVAAERISGGGSFLTLAGTDKKEAGTWVPELQKLLQRMREVLLLCSSLGAEAEGGQLSCPNAQLLRS